MSKVKVEILPKSNNPLYIERETGVTHTPFKLELDLFNAIKEGNEDKLKASISSYMEYGFVIGHMTSTNENNIVYWAIATISIAIHYAILGGLDETDAYNMSDKYIQEIDTIHDFESCLNYLETKGLELVRAVNKSKHKYSKNIYKCIHYIHIHLHEKLTIQSLADYLDISRDYLSILFKKEVGMSLHSYIIRKRIEASLDMIKEGKSYEEIAYTLCFCSQTHFINAFKKEMGITPSKYRNNLK